MLQVIKCPVAKHKVAVATKNAVKENGVEVHMHLIKVHVRHIYNVRGDRCAKFSMHHKSVDVEVEKTDRKV